MPSSWIRCALSVPLLCVLLTSSRLLPVRALDFPNGPPRCTGGWSMRLNYYSSSTALPWLSWSGTDQQSVTSVIDPRRWTIDSDSYPTIVTMEWGWTAQRVQTAYMCRDEDCRYSRSFDSIVLIRLPGQQMVQPPRYTRLTLNGNEGAYHDDCELFRLCCVLSGEVLLVDPTLGFASAPTLTAALLPSTSGSECIAALQLQWSLLPAPEALLLANATDEELCHIEGHTIPLGVDRQCTSLYERWLDAFDVRIFVQQEGSNSSFAQLLTLTDVRAMRNRSTQLTVDSCGALLLHGGTRTQQAYSASTSRALNVSSMLGLQRNVTYRLAVQLFNPLSLHASNLSEPVSITLPPECSTCVACSDPGDSSSSSSSSSAGSVALSSSSGVGEPMLSSAQPEFPSESDSFTSSAAAEEVDVDSTGQQTSFASSSSSSGDTVPISELSDISAAAPPLSTIGCLSALSAAAIAGLLTLWV